MKVRVIRETPRPEPEDNCLAVFHCEDIFVSGMMVELSLTPSQANDFYEVLKRVAGERVIIAETNARQLRNKKERERNGTSTGK